MDRESVREAHAYFRALNEQQEREEFTRKVETERLSSCCAAADTEQPVWVALGGHSSQKKIICSKKKVKELVKGKNEKKKMQGKGARKRAGGKEDKQGKQRSCC